MEAPNAGVIGEIGDFRQTTRQNSKTWTAASVVNLVWSQVYHSERPALFAALFAMMQCIVRVRQRELYTCLESSFCSLFACVLCFHVGANISISFNFIESLLLSK